MLASEHFSRAPKACDDLVGDEQATVSVAYLSKHGPVVGAGYHGAHGTGNRLGNHRRHRVRTLKFDNLLDGPGTPFGALFRGGAAVLAAVRIGLGSVEHSGQQWLVVCLGEDGRPAQGQRSEGGAVV